MSAIEQIGRALKYDAVESILAYGGSFNDALRLAAAVADLAADSDDAALSVAPTTLATVPA